MMTLTATCTACDTQFTVDLDEDGFPDAAPGEHCADMDCGIRLCPCCPQFACDGCGMTFCLDHQVLVPDGTDRPLRLCKGCAMESEVWPEIPKLEPLTVTLAVPNIPEWKEIA